MLPNDPDFYKALLDSISDGVYFVDLERRILFWNEGAHRLTGYQASEMLGRRCPEGFLCQVDENARPMCPDRCPLSSCLEDGQTHEVHFFFRHKLGRRVPITARVEPIRASDGSIIGALEIFADDSAQQDARRRVEEMERLAFFDHAVQLPNRRFVEMSLCTALTEYHSHKDPFGVMLFDVDDLKEINDEFGHAVGDRALRGIAQTLAGALRPSDVVGRWGGDEFVGIARHVNSENLKHLAKRCRAMVAETRLSTGANKSVQLTVSIGETLVQGSDTAESLIRRADELMYQNKIRGEDTPIDALLQAVAPLRISLLLKTAARRLLSLSRFFAARQR